MIRNQKMKVGGKEGRGGGVLVHVFSNGGCMSLKWLNQELEKSSGYDAKEETEKTPLLSKSQETTNPSLDPPTTTSMAPLPAQAIIFDSCPGRSSLLVTMRAFSAPIRSKFLKIPAMGLLAVLHGLIALYNMCVSLKPPIFSAR